MDLEGLSTDQLERELVRFETVRRQAAAVLVALIGEADRRQVPLADGARSITEWAAARLDLPATEARTLTDLAKRLDALPETAARLARGESGPHRAAIVARVADAGSESRWWERLSGHSLAGAERVAARHRRVSRNDERRSHEASFFSVQPSLDESWWDITGGLGGLAGQVVSDALREKAEQFPREEGSLPHRQALALEALCTGDRPSTGSVTVFFDTTAAADPDGEIGETGAELAAGPRLGPAALHEVLCGGTVRPIQLKGGKMVGAGPKTSRIPPAVRQFVLWRDGGCRAPGCTSRYRLQPHHIVPDSHHGRHHPDNLITLCWYHHHIVVHRRGLRIVRLPEGNIRFSAPADTRAPP